MKTLEFKTGKGDFALVDLQGYEYTLFNGYLVLGSNKSDVAGKMRKISIGDNRGFLQYEKAFILKEMTEERAEEIVDSKHMQSFCSCEYCGYEYDVYRDYKNQSLEDWNEYPEADGFRNGIDSLNSLLTSLGIHLYENPLGTYEFAHKRHIVNGTWQQAEENTFYDPILLKKI